MSKIVLKEYNYDTKATYDLGEVSTHTLVRSMDEQQFADLLDDYCNCGMKDYRNGLKEGRLLQNTHRTIQASIIRFCLGIIIGLSDQQYTDARNERPVEMGRKIAKLVDDGELVMGCMI